MAQPLGYSGALAKKFLDSQITPLLALVGVLMGLFAVLITPREEEPQIEVTFANVFIAFPGASAEEVEQLVSTPAEQVLSEIEGVKHVYSVSSQGLSVLTVEFDIGESRTQAIVRLYNGIFSNQDWLPPNLGVAQPIVKPMGIDDVPIVTLTLWSPRDEVGAYELQKVAHALETELKRVPGTRDIYTVGEPDEVVHVMLDPQRLAGYNIAVDDLRRALQAANVSRDAGEMVRDNREITLRAGTFLSRSEDIAGLVIGVHETGPIYLSDVATVRRGPPHPKRYAWFGTGVAAAEKGIAARGEFPAVTIAIAKKPGTNAVHIAEDLLDRVQQLKGLVIPEDVNVTVTRNYGQTAFEKVRSLITKLVFATASVVILVLLTVGRREALIVGAAVVITLLVTLFASWAWGFTLNRVSLFALIFSIGILVDDAIVVVENIHRHLQRGSRDLKASIAAAVDEVGGPTILATFTVIAALLPMAFVTGLMGPYMSPIPINASMGMFVSLAVAFVITPWLALKLLRKTAHTTQMPQSQRVQRLFAAILEPFLESRQGRTRRWLLFGVVMMLIVAAVALAFAKLVVLKMLPFDNKSEFQVIVDMPEGTTLQQTARVLGELGRYIARVPEVTDYQVYVGTASPINFNGLIRQYYLRSGSHLGDIQVNLVDKSKRDRQSHAIAAALREPLQRIAAPLNANVKIVEVPPGPPVMAPLVAEIYGIDRAGQERIAKSVRSVLQSTPGVVDLDDSIEAPTLRYVIAVDRERAAGMGISQAAIVDTITVAMKGDDVSFLRDPSAKYAVPVRVELPVASKRDVDAFLDLKLRTSQGALVPVRELVTVTESTKETAIYHKDLLPVVFVTGDVAGAIDSPLYGMFAAYAQLDDGAAGQRVQQLLFSGPGNLHDYSLKWDGEWQITFETFRDMGLAYGVGLVLIYLLVVAQFRSYLVPLIIMAPIPLTIIGVMPGHALLGQPFTATSMIGMIALAGIIVRNSILLVDFINLELSRGVSYKLAVVSAAAVRARPVVLTAVAAMLGALFILNDPIFNGLAISLIFGIFVSTALTLVVVPLMVYAFLRNRHSGGELVGTEAKAE